VCQLADVLSAARTSGAVVIKPRFLFNFFE
jgi:hypothetical protein